MEEGLVGVAWVGEGVASSPAQQMTAQVKGGGAPSRRDSDGYTEALVGQEIGILCLHLVLNNGIFQVDPDKRQDTSERSFEGWSAEQIWYQSRSHDLPIMHIRLILDS